MGTRMKTWMLIGYFVAPALLLISPSMGLNDNHPLVASELFEFAIINYLFFAAPMLLWAAASKIFRLTVAVSQAGYLGAMLALLLLLILFNCCADNSNMIGWLYYWPLAIVFSIWSAMYVRFALQSPHSKKVPKTCASDLSFENNKSGEHPTCGKCGRFMVPRPQTRRSLIDIVGACLLWVLVTGIVIVFVGVFALSGSTFAKISSFSALILIPSFLIWALSKLTGFLKMHSWQCSYCELTTTQSS